MLKTIMKFIFPIVLAKAKKKQEKKDVLLKWVVTVNPEASAQQASPP